jgi:hypothetical protein
VTFAGQDSASALTGDCADALAANNTQVTLNAICRGISREKFMSRLRGNEFEIGDS